MSRIERARTSKNKTSTEAIPGPQSKRFKSWVWHYFVQTEYQINCKICNERACAKFYSTTPLIRHLRNVHNIKDPSTIINDFSQIPTIRPPVRIEGKAKHTQMRERILNSFDKIPGGSYHCRECDYTCDTCSIYLMFVHLSESHWKESAELSGPAVVERSNQSHKRSKDRRKSKKCIPRHFIVSNYTNLPKSTKSKENGQALSYLSEIEEAEDDDDDPHNYTDSDDQYDAYSDSNDGVPINKLVIDCPSPINDINTNADNDQRDLAQNDNAVFNGEKVPPDCTKNVTQAQNVVVDKQAYQPFKGFPVVVVDVRQNIADDIKEEVDIDISGSQIPINGILTEISDPYIRESGGKPVAVSSTRIEPQTQSIVHNAQGRNEIENGIEVIKLEDSDGSDSEMQVPLQNYGWNNVQRIKLEELDPSEIDIQVPLQITTSFTPEGQPNKDGQTQTCYECIKTEKAGKEKNVAVITLNRPKVLNALCRKLVDEVNDAVTKFNSDNSIGAIIITGSGKAFAAGTDIREMQNHTYIRAIRKEFHISWNGISEASKPVIAAVNGYALGGGCELALMCDIIYAGETACFGQPEIIMGTIPGAGGTQRLTRAIGKSKAMEMILTGSQISAMEAEKSGLVSKIFPPGQLLPEAIKLAEKICIHSQLIVSIAKEAVNSAYETTLKQGLHLEKKLYCNTIATADRREGMAAFLERRAPKFINK